MKFKTLLYLLALSVIIVSCNTRARNEDATEKYFSTIKKEGDNAKLTMFMSLMPKGGDLHHHYSGALFAETYLDWAARKNSYIDTRNFSWSRVDTCKYDITIDSLRRNATLYRTLIEQWSDEDFSNNYHAENPPDQHFFNTFSLFGPISGLYYRDGLAEIKQEALKENVMYIETMLGIPPVSVQFNKGVTDSLVYYQSKGDTLGLYHIFDQLALSIKSDANYNTALTNYMDSLYSYHKGIDDSNFTMRFQLYVYRKSSPANVFTTLYASFDAVTKDKSSLLVGVNIVGAENSDVSMQDYWLHMQMFRYLKRKFPSVKTSMHAGELAMGMVKPKDLTYHIYDAIFIAGANRIGHGVDIPYETNALQVLKKMKTDSIAIEINLTSNEFILGVKGNDHPINIYADAGVPIVISTDDAGVSRNNLSVEYATLASRYHFSYKQIKVFAFNSIRYSFLKDSEKLSLEKKLNEHFDVFESQVATELYHH